MEKMSFPKRFFSHLHTINTHRNLVLAMCFRCGMYSQGLKHDLSKYAPVEFFPSVRYYQGYRSPISKEKEVNGYSTCWFHHKGRNPHHWEYWIDRGTGSQELRVFPMPFRYLLESVIDRIAASKVYNKGKYNDNEPYRFFINSKEHAIMNPETVAQMEYLLKYLAENGEKKALQYYRSLYKQCRKDKNFTLNF